MDLEWEEVRVYLRENSVWTPFCGCWLWLGAYRGNNYGSTKDFKGKQHYAHRLAYLAFRGDFDNRLWVLHRCDTSLCINPDHLFLGTADDNNRDMMIKGRFKNWLQGNGHLVAKEKNPMSRHNREYRKIFTR